MPSKWTFEIAPIALLVKRYVRDGALWADPFAGQNNLAAYRNDLNPENKQPFCLEALEFVSLFADSCLAGVVFDPPYSLTQVSRSYQEFGKKFKGKENPTGGFPKVKDEISRVVKPGGYVLHFGWNTVGMGIKRNFEIIEILIVCHGGNRNDTLVTVERKN